MNDRELQEVLDGTLSRLGVVGAQVAIFDGQHQREFAAGYRNRELALPVTTDTVFQVGSTTKLFNAALLLSLVDEEKLALDIPLRTHLPRFRLSDPEAQRKVTLRQLLSMSAGIDNGPYHDYGRGDDALGRYVDVLAGIPQVFAPGSAFGYSNASTNIAGCAAATVMGKTWEHLLSERILSPLGLRNTALFAEDLVMHPVALGYKRAQSGQALRRNAIWSLTRSMAPAGSLTCCSAGDLIKLARVFLGNGKSADGVRVLSEASVDTLHRPQIELPTQLIANQWCTGPYRKTWSANVVYGHSGTNLSGASTLLWCPGRGIAIAVVVNAPEFGYDFADTVFAAVLPAVFGFGPPPVPSVKETTPLETDFNPYVGTFEAFGTKQDTAIQNGKLVLTATASTMGDTVTRNCQLIPLGSGRFLPSDYGVPGNRTWDVAFWGADGSGRATHLLNGVFALRRTA